jgi:hypothetical protein
MAKSKHQRPKNARGVPHPGKNTAADSTHDDPALEEKTAGRSEPRDIPHDPDGRVAPDHQHDGREDGRTPDQTVVEHAREQQSPPLNPGTKGDDHVAED